MVQYFKDIAKNQEHLEKIWEYNYDRKERERIEAQREQEAKKEERLREQAEKETRLREKEAISDEDRKIKEADKWLVPTLIFIFCVFLFISFLSG